MNQSLIDSKALERGLRRCWKALVSDLSGEHKWCFCVGFGEGC